MTFDILECGLARWTSLWGDPLVTGLVIMALFLVAAALCAWAAGRTAGRERVFWALAAAATLIFATNVHLDLHVLPTAIGRCMSRAQGWYDQREIARTAFKIMAAIGMAGLLVAIVRKLWRQLVLNVLVTFGFIVTIAVYAGKGFGRRRWEKLYDIPVGPFQLPDLPDMAGAALIILGAGLALRRMRGDPELQSDRVGRLP